MSIAKLDRRFELDLLGGGTDKFGWGTSLLGESRVELKKIWIKTKNALLVLLVACVGLGASSTIAWGNTVQSGFNLNYFHSYRAART
jgi:hypothetical protein